MRRIGIFLICFACSSYGRRVQTPKPRASDEGFDADVSQTGSVVGHSRKLESLATFLFAQMPMRSANKNRASRVPQPTSTATLTREIHTPMRMAGYVPDGLTPEQWKKMKEEEKAKKAGLGRVGVRGYKSRSFQSFQEALERGEASHLMPVNPEKVRSGEIPIEEVPYMQRGGSWDGSDLSGLAKWRARTKQKRFQASGGKAGAYTAGKWLKSDKDYAKRGEKASQSVSIFGGASLPWQTGNVNSADKKKPTTDAEMWRYAGALSEREAKMNRGVKLDQNTLKQISEREQKKKWWR